MSERFTKKQRQLLDACASQYEKSAQGIKVACFLGMNDHSFTTAKSLEKRGYLQITNNGLGEAWAEFSGENYSDYVALFEKNGGSDE
jgi:hypothetical protein